MDNLGYDPEKRTWNEKIFNEKIDKFKPKQRWQYQGSYKNIFLFIMSILLGLITKDYVWFCGLIFGVIEIWKNDNEK